MWLIIFAVLTLAAVGSVFYLTSRIRRFSALQKLAESHKFLSWLLALLPVLALGAACYFIFNLFTMFVILLHLMFIWMVCDLIAAMIRGIARKERRRNIEGIAAILLTVAVLGYGWYEAHTVRVTHYSFTTQKSIGEPLRIAMFADSHLGATLNGESFAREMEKLQAESPDVVLLVGDFVDDDSEKADMLSACETLGGLQTTYGVYFVYGNHDNGYYDYRNFTSQELRDALTENGVTILEDEALLIDDRFYLTGRLDKTYENRVAARELIFPLNSNIYNILLDHQPNDYEAEAESGADLVLSGHTHGGHIFPAGQIGLLLHINDRIYGTETRGKTTFLVTSGISGWAIPFKTGTFSEICIIDISEE